MLAELNRYEIVEWFLAIALLVVGTSLMLRARHWIGIVSGVMRHPLTPFFTGLYALLMGLAVGLSHNLWVADARVIVTVLGWASAAFGALVMIVPEVYSALVRRFPLTPSVVAIRGAVRFVLGGAIVTYLLTQTA
ncbi:MAG: hypothetical protein LW636_01815 [Planctomycetaceae bacterium]|jgi:uncharacterized membrane protein|nr:hypothetical protein [Planctomycetaceae bacterium]